MGRDDRTGKKNVILILSDSLKASHLGCYGYDRPTSPNIDSLAREGVTFTRAFTHAPFTHASVVTILSSQYPSHHGILKAEDIIDEDIRLFPQYLEEAGIRTGAFTANPNVSVRGGHSRGFEHFYEGKGLPKSLWRSLRWRIRWWEDSLGDRCERMNRNMVTYLDRVKDDQFFIFAFYIDTHSPFRPPARYIRRFSRNFPLFYDRGRIISPQIYKGYSDEDLREIIARYDADINYFDDNLKTLLEYLDENGLNDKTMIMFSSDHGEGFRFQSDGHGQVYEDGIHIPLILKGPKIPRSRKVAGMVGTLDYGPTIMDYLGLDVPDDCQGRSMLPLISKGGRGRRHILVEFTKSCAIRTERWKYISNRVGLDPKGRTDYFRNWDAKPPEELYHLHEDPGETVNVVGRYPNIARKYASRLKRELERIQRPKRKLKQYELDEEIIDRLRGLGYM